MVENRVAKKRLTLGLGIALRALAVLTLVSAFTLAVANTGTEATAPPFAVEIVVGPAEDLTIAGAGTTSDPLLISHGFATPEPILLKITVRDGEAHDGRSYSAFNWQYLRLSARFSITNLTGHGFIGFDFELQEVLRKPSVYRDGLSFDQLETTPAWPPRSPSFALVHRDSEPYDRLRFRDGFIDPAATTVFTLTVIDVTPKPVFYLLLRPILPMS